MSDNPDRLARLALSVIEPSPRLRRAVRARGPAAVWADLPARFPGIDPAAILTGYARDGWRLVCPGDEEWPPALAGLDTTADDTGGLRALWVRGQGHLASVTTRSVTITGSYASTSYGNHGAQDPAEHDNATHHQMIVATWLLMGQTLVRTQTETAPRPARTRIARIDPSLPAAVRCVDLRRIRSNAPDSGVPASRTYHRRWVVNRSLAPPVVPLPAAAPADLDRTPPRQTRRRPPSRRGPGPRPAPLPPGQRPDRRGELRCSVFWI